jgi:hypothetical protein
VNRSVWRLELLKSNVSWLEAVPNMALVSRSNHITHNPILSPSLSGGAHDRWQSHSSVSGGGLALVVAVTTHNRVRVRILVGDLSPMGLEEVGEEVCGPDDGAAGRRLSHEPWAGAEAIRPQRNTCRPTSGFTRNPSRVRAMQTLSDYEQGRSSCLLPRLRRRLTCYSISLRRQWCFDHAKLCR